MRRDVLRRLRPVLLLMFVAAFLGWPWVVGTPFLLNLVTGGVIWAIFSVSYDLVLGWTGEISFGHALWFGMGIYGVALLSTATGLDTLLAIVAVALLTIPVALVLHLVSLRLRGAYFAMITFALAEFVHLLAENATALTGGTNGLTGIPLSPYLMQPGILYLVAGIVLGLSVAALRGLQVRRIGRIVHAVRDNPTRAALFGFSEVWVKAWTLVAASLLAVLAGGLFLAYQGMAFPGAFDSQTSFTVLLMATIGGADSAWGPAVAGIGLYMLENSLGATTAHWSLVLGLVYIAVVRFLPGGLGALFGRRSLGGHGRTAAATAILQGEAAPGPREQGGLSP